MSILDVLRRRPIATGSSTDLRASLSDMEAARTAVATKVAELEARSGDIVLEGDEANIAAHWRTLQEARLEFERLAAAASAMPARIAAAHEAEEAVRLDKVRRGAEVASDEWMATAPELIAACEHLWALIEAQDARMATIQTAHRELRSHGQMPVAAPQLRFWLRPQYDAAPYVTEYGPHTILPGPRGGCRTRAAWRAEIDRARTEAPDDGVVVGLARAS